LIAIWASAVVCVAATQVTYHQDIAPILLHSCSPCHRPGQAGPFALLTYDDAKRHAGQIAAVTRRRYMPPWLPESGYGEFQDERRLSDAEIRLIEAWARAGAPEGVARDAPAVPPETQEWALGPPDLIVRASKPFTLAADGRDVFWNFVLPAPVSAARYVKAVEIRPGSTRVHHANLLVDRARSTRRQERVPGAGFAGMDLTIETDAFDPDSHFLFWKPGGTPRAEPDGMAWQLDPGSDLVLNVHLQPSGKVELVQPSVGLYFTDVPPSRRPMLMKVENDRALDIPPGARDFAVSEDFRLPIDLDVLAVYPHAHYLGTLLEGFATLPDGSRRGLIRIPQWDVNWQSVYPYRSPVFLPKGTVVSMRYHYDNSSGNPRNPSHPPKRVTGGDQSTDEMAHLWLQVIPRGAGDQRAVLQEGLMRHRIEKNPADAEAHLNLGTLALGRNHGAEAIPHLREALRLMPEQAQALNNYGAALQSEGRLAEAVEQFGHALRVQPDYPNARYNLANALLAQGKLEQAAANLRQVLAAVPQDPAARTQLSAALLRIGEEAIGAGNLAAAASTYRELTALEPENADLRNNFGIILAKSGDLQGAIEQFEAALAINPLHAAASRNLSRMKAIRK
jgi:Flp pilus assembly protein TadD